MTASLFRESVAWQKAMTLAEAVYTTTQEFPREEVFGLTSQLRRASVSIASNIAEGHIAEGQGRLTRGEFAHFIGMARESALEVQTQLLLEKRLKFGEGRQLETAQAKAIEMVKILNAVLSGLRRKK